MEKQMDTELNFFPKNEHFSRPPEGGEIMAVFRIEKNPRYTVMANHHLRNTALSLKAKGLLSLMLSLPEDWDYTTKGLARICRGWSGQHLCYGPGAGGCGIHYP